MTETTVAASFAKALLEFAASSGADRAVLMARSGVGPEDLAEADGRVPYAKLTALMRAAEARDPALALHKMALDYLTARRVSVNEAAYLAGFSDPATFSRAFKRWTGMSPREARAVRN